MLSKKDPLVLSPNPLHNQSLTSGMCDCLSQSGKAIPESNLINGMVLSVCHSSNNAMSA